MIPNPAYVALSGLSRIFGGSIGRQLFALVVLIGLLCAAGAEAIARAVFCPGHKS